jgi:hypothetical protein
MPRLPAIALLSALVPVLVLHGGTARAGVLGDDYNIMVPEKGVKPPPHKAKRRGSSVIVAPAPLPAPQPYVPPVAPVVTNNPPAVPPPLVAPNGQVLPNMPSIIGAGPNGTETYQDRAVRCAHQAGVYGGATGNPSAYVGSCINQ